MGRELVKSREDTGNVIYRNNNGCFYTILWNSFWERFKDYSSDIQISRVCRWAASDAETRKSWRRAKERAGANRGGAGQLVVILCVACEPLHLRQLLRPMPVSRQGRLLGWLHGLLVHPVPPNACVHVTFSSCIVGQTLARTNPLRQTFEGFVSYCPHTAKPCRMHLGSRDCIRS